MCAIAGSTNPNFTTKALKELNHRGPDESGNIAFYGEKFWFAAGMNRLKIIDLSSDNLTPYKFKNYTLFYNGEIYNYKEIREELKMKGYSFETSSDIEVALKAYDQWKEKCLDKFNGMFALAIVDDIKRKVFLARDIAGQKPLYYKKNMFEFSFASEAKVLKEKIVQAENYDILQHTLTDTLYFEVNALPPAHYAYYDVDSNKLEIKRYWEFKPRFINPNTVLEELDYLLTQAVNRVTNSDVPIALYKSDGVDSGILAEIISLDEITYPDQEDFSKDFKKNIKKIVKQLDFPVGSFSTYGLFWLAREAKRRKFTVVVSGEGADEIFGGYMRYLPVATQYQLSKKYPSYSKMFKDNNVMKYMGLSYRGGEPYDLIKLMEPYFEKYDPITAMQMFDFENILPSLLQMGDRMASMFSLENRCPYLDKDLIEFGLSLPPELKIHNLETKVLLRRVAKKLEVYYEKEKKGLVVPFNKWMGIEGFDRSEYFKYINKIWESI